MFETNCKRCAENFTLKIDENFVGTQAKLDILKVKRIQE